MASPQKENGYVAIATELFEAMIRFRIPGECEQVFKLVIRKTYGFNKKEDKIANSQFVDATGMKKGNVSRALSKLITNKLVIRSDNNSKDGNTYKINKDYQEWIPFIIRSDNKKKKLSKRQPKLSKEITNVIRSDNKVLSEVMDTIDNNHIKDTIQKTGKTPSQNAKSFFNGVGDLKEKKSSSEAEATKQFLQKLQEKYPDASKRILWDEVVKFWSYWTELNATGRKERWEKQDAFQVERRLGTWFSKIKDFQSKEKSKSNYSPDKIH